MDIDERRIELGARLSEAEQTFARQMRERGFDPGQAENIALPGPLAELYLKLEELRAELLELESNTGTQLQNPER